MDNSPYICTMEARKCKQCNKEYIPKTNRISSFCSELCQRTDYRLRRKSNSIYIPTMKKCKVCDNEFFAKLYNHRFCSPECRAKEIKRVGVRNNRKYRAEFREKYKLPSSREFQEFVHNQELLDNNPILLETLQIIHKIKQTKGSKLPIEVRRQNKKDYQRAYNNRPVDGYGEYKCDMCSTQFTKKSDRHRFCSKRCNEKFWRKKNK